MDTMVSLKEEKGNKRKGMITSVIVHILLLVLLILPFIGYPVPPPGQQGILVSLGEPDRGQGDDLPETQDKVPVEETAQPASRQEQVDRDKTASRASKVVEQQKEVLTSEELAEIALKKQKEEERRQQEIEAQKEKERLAEIARKKAAEEAARKAAFEESKQLYSDMIGGAGKGNTGTPGNQGDPDGDPNAQVLQGLSTGSGVVGGGLGDRGVLYEPSVQDQSQKTGTVVVNVCVDKAGNILSANYTQRGSTTTDSDLRRLAERSARKFRFTPSDIEKQCGTITIDFKLK